MELFNHSYLSLANKLIYTEKTILNIVRVAFLWPLWVISVLADMPMFELQTPHVSS